MGGAANEGQRAIDLRSAPTDRPPDFLTLENSPHKMSDQEKQEKHKRADPDEEVDSQFWRFDFFLVHGGRILSGPWLDTTRNNTAELSSAGRVGHPPIRGSWRKKKAAILSRPFVVKSETRGRFAHDHTTTQSPA